MSAELQSRPERTITVEGTPFTIRWNAAFNTIQYFWIRQDIAVFTTTFEGAGVIRILLGGDQTSLFTAGDDVFIKTALGKYTGTRPVIFVDYPVSGSRTEVLIGDFENLGQESGGYLNNITTHPNYKLEVELYKASNNLLLDTVIIYGSNEWELKARFQRQLRAQLSTKDTILYDVTNATELNKAVEFYVKWKEIWDGSSESEVDDSGNTLYATNSALQLQDLYAGNMGEYVLMAENYLASKFLTMFEQPSYWEGYPWDIGFILDDNVAGLLGGSPLQVLAKTEHAKDINGGTIQTEIILLDDSTGFVHRMQLEGGYTSAMKTLNLFVGIEDGSDIDLYVEPGYVAPGYVGSGTLEGDSSNRLTELKVINLKNVDCENPVYLKWLNPLGTYDQWLFEHKQEINWNVTAKDLFTNDVEDWATAEEISEYTRKSGTEKMILGADNLTTQEKDAIKWVLMSPKVYQMQIDKTRLTVLVAPGSFQIKNTRRDLHNIEFEIIFPEINIQGN